MSTEQFNINKLPTDGYLVLPLSMSRLQGGQSPEWCNEVVRYFEEKVSAVGVDAVFLYTNGLYYNNDEPALTVRKRTNSQMLRHKNELVKLFSKEKKYIPQAMHYLPWDYTILSSSRYEEYFNKLKKESEENRQFADLLKLGLFEREPSEANVSFLIEEIVVTHLIREEWISFPKTLVQKDTFRLVAYPGACFQADVYQWKHDLLPKNPECDNPYRSAHYNFNDKLLEQFDRIDV